MSPYEVLNVPKNASQDDIKKAFRKLSLEHHPDRGGETSKFQEINNAYETLSNEDKRRQFDQSQNGGGFHQFNFNSFNHPGFAQFDQIFQMFGMGRGGQNPHREPDKVKLEDSHHTIELTLKESYFGVTKNVVIGMTKKCDCVQWCKSCHSKGTIRQQMRLNQFQAIEMDSHCNDCDGKGFKTKDCQKCNNSTTLTTKELIQLSLQEGIKHDTQIRLHEKGKQSSRQFEIPGDLVITIKIQNDQFKREDKNLIYSQDISFNESILGKKIIVPHYDGEFEIMTQTQFGVIFPNKEYVIKEKGMKFDNKKGDLIIKFNHIYPKELKFDQTCLDALKPYFV